MKAENGKRRSPGRNEILKRLSLALDVLAPRYGVAMAGVFGSIATGTFGAKSDVDVLVRFSIPIGFVQLIRLENELSRTLRRKVDLVTESSLSPYFRDDVIRNLEVMYEEKRRSVYKPHPRRNR